MKTLEKISESTSVTLSLVIALVGGILWLSSIFSQGQANAREIQTMSQDFREFKADAHIENRDFKQKLYEKLLDIEKRLTRIESKIGH